MSPYTPNMPLLIRPTVSQGFVVVLSGRSILQEDGIVTAAGYYTG